MSIGSIGYLVPGGPWTTLMKNNCNCLYADDSQGEFACVYVAADISKRSDSCLRIFVYNSFLKVFVEVHYVAAWKCMLVCWFLIAFDQKSTMRFQVLRATTDSESVVVTSISSRIFSFSNIVFYRLFVVFIWFSLHLLFLIGF